MAKCLVVDDVAVSRFAVESFLGNLGIEIEEAVDEKQALEALEQGGIDVILLDWHLKKKSGLELLTEIRERYGKDLKIVVFTGVEGEDKVDEAMAAGANGFINKPTTEDKISEQFKVLGIL